MNLRQDRGSRSLVLVAGACLVAAVGMALADVSPASAAKAPPAQGTKKPTRSASAEAVLHYAEAIGSGDPERFAQLDFACQFERVGRTTPQNSEPAVPGTAQTNACWQRLLEGQREAISQTDEGINTQWPGQGRLVFFDKPLSQYPASTFVMNLIGQSPPGSGFEAHILAERPITASSFPSRDGKRTVSVPTSLVQLRITYKDVLTAPEAYAPGAYQYTSPVARPRIAIRSIDLQFVVASGLRPHGFPHDVAVMNIPVADVSPQERGLRRSIPFTTETSHAVEQSVINWQPNDVPGILLAAVARSRHYPELRDRMSLLNRILMIDPRQPEALMTVSNELYGRLLATGEAAPPPLTKDPSLARRLAELSWNSYAQTARTDLSLSMHMGGVTEPNSADFLYRLVPTMEALQQVRPRDLDNRLHLGIAYRWNNDQRRSIQTHEALVKDLETARPDQRARALLELAWSRISKVAWNRILDDPDIQLAYREAEQAYNLTEDPLDKFMASYTQAYSRLFMPQRDAALMLTHLTQAKEWFDQTPGATHAAWNFALGRELLKAVLDADPQFQPLLAAPEDKKG